MKPVQSLENLRIEMYGSGRRGKVLCRCDYERVGVYCTMDPISSLGSSRHLSGNVLSTLAFPWCRMDIFGVASDQGGSAVRKA